MNKIKHCTIAYTFYEIDYRVRRYAELFSKDPKNTVHVLSLRNEPNIKKSTFNGATIFHLQKRVYNEKGPLTYFSKIMRFFFLSMFKVTLNHFRYGYNIIHIHNVPDFLVFTAIIPKLFGAKIVLDIHDILPELYCEKFKTKENSLLGKALRFIEHISVKFADHVIVANDIWMKRIQERNNLPKSKCTTILNYPNTSFFSNEEKQIKSNNSPFNIVYPGHLSYHHGIDVAIKALDIVKKQNVFFHFHIYARTFVATYRKTIEKLILDLNLQDNITIHKPITPEQIPNVLHQADIGLVPKRGTGFAGEAFSTKLFDFFAAGLPIVASSTVVDRYYFDDSNIKFFEDENYKDCAEKIIALIASPKERKALSKKGLSYVEENNWLNKSTIYSDLLSSLVNKF